MKIVVQILVLTFIILSTLLVIGIPVTLASPGQWEKSKNLIYTGIGIWIGIVLTTGIINSFIS